MKPNTIAGLIVCVVALLTPLDVVAQTQMTNPQAQSNGTWGPPMRLGRPADAVGLSEEKAEPKVKKNQCRRWRAMAMQLGESYAGYALRSSVIRRMCEGPVAEKGPDVWDWPWAGLSQGRFLPPRIHKTFEDWQIRCGTGQWRNRCAAVSVIAPKGNAASSQAEAALISHFVIDMVAGRESVLWRLYVPGDAGDVATPAESKRRERVASSHAARSDPRVIEYEIDGKTRRDRFTTCGATGCMLEASLSGSSDVATKLWDGEGVDVAVARPTSVSLSITLPARGFRAALGELIRLRRLDEASRR